MHKEQISNRILFVFSVVLTGAIAGAFVWAILFVMGLGISLIWETLPGYFGPYFPLLACTLGGLIIGLFSKHYGPLPEELEEVMAKVKKDGRYEYDKLGRMSIAALLPLFFGGSIGPEAGLTGCIAGICTWVGDRMKRFGSDFKQLTSVGTMAALSAIFTAPLFGFVAPLCGDTSKDTEDSTLVLPKRSKMVLYFCAIAGALGAYLGLSALFGSAMALPHYDNLTITSAELLWLIPLALIGTAAGWLYCVCDGSFALLAKKIGDKPVIKAVIAGLVLALCGLALPFTMFAGETQAEELNEIWMSMTAFVLIATGFVKVALTPLCVQFGWRGGHFFPLIFAGISIGYGIASLTGIDPVFALCACTAALLGASMRQPLLAVLLLFLCFPIEGVFVMIAAAALGAAVPLPASFKREPALKKK